jgi:hypothetical protein
VNKFSFACRLIFFGQFLILVSLTAIEKIVNAASPENMFSGTSLESA